MISWTTFIYRFLFLSIFFAGTLFAEGTVIDDFETGLISGWKVKEFRGKTNYSVDSENGNHYLKAESHASASGLVFKIEYELKEFPYLTWRWKILNTLAKGNGTKKSGDDYAARVYVIFPHWFPPMTKSINYIWANKLKKDVVLPNPYYSKTVMVVVESGNDLTGKWVKERRNVLEDYRNIFKEEPPRVGAIGIMTDTDDTGENAVGCYDDIILEK